MKIKEKGKGKPKRKRISWSPKKIKLNKGLQIYKIKEHLKSIGIKKGDLELIDFEAHVDSTLTYNENLRIILEVVIQEHLVDYTSEQYDSMIETLSENSHRKLTPFSHQF